MISEKTALKKTFVCKRPLTYAYKMLFLKRERKETLVISRSRWYENIRTDIKQIGCDCVDWIHLTQHADQWHRIVNTVRIFRSQKWQKILDLVSDYRLLK
jgi:hypothetical protein